MCKSLGDKQLCLLGVHVRAFTSTVQCPGGGGCFRHHTGVNY